MPRQPNKTCISHTRQLQSFLSAALIFRYNYVYPKQSRYILVLDRSKNMEEFDRWDNLHRSVVEFMTVLPVESELSIITFGKNAVMKFKKHINNFNSSTLKIAFVKNVTFTFVKTKKRLFRLTNNKLYYLYTTYC